VAAATFPRGQRKDEGKFAGIGIIMNEIPQFFGTSLLGSAAALAWQITPTTELALRNVGISMSVTTVVTILGCYLFKLHHRSRYGPSSTNNGWSEIFGATLLIGALLGNGVLLCLTKPTVTGILLGLGLTVSQSIISVLAMFATLSVLSGN